MTQATTLPTMDLQLGEDPVFQRPELALINLISGRFGAAGRSLVAPGTLSPEERKTLAARWGIDNTPLEILLDVTTNPVVLAGLIFTMMTHTPLAPELLTFKGGVAKVTPKLGWMRFISPVRENVRGTELDMLFAQTTRMSTQEKQFMEGLWADTVLRPLKNRRGYLMSGEEEGMLYAFLDGLTGRAKDHKALKTARGVLREEGLDDLADALVDPLPHVDEKLDPFLKNLGLSGHRKIIYGESTSVYERWLKDPEMMENYLTHLARRHGIRPQDVTELKPELANSMPHQPLFRTADEDFEAVQNVIEAIKGKSVVASKAAQSRPGKTTSASLAARRNTRLPDPEAMKALGASDQAVEALETAGAILAEAAGRTKPAFYKVHYSDTMRRYMQEIATTKGFATPAYAWDDAGNLLSTQGRDTLVQEGVDGRPMGDRIMSRLQQMRAQDKGTRGPGTLEAETIEGVTLPMMLGGLTQGQANSALQWAAQKQLVLKILEQPSAKNALGPTGDRIRKWLLDEKKSGWQAIGAELASYTYTTTLGFPNLVSPGFNLLQGLNNLGLGSEYVMGGYRVAAGSMMKYAENRVVHGMDKMTALKKADPVFHDSLLYTESRVGEYVADLMEDILVKSAGHSPLRQSWEKIKDNLMGVFSNSELFNRMATFHTGRLKGLAELPGEKVWSVKLGKMVQLSRNPNDPAVQRAAREFGEQVVHMTQFGGGPLERPLGPLQWWPPLAQFTTFPLRQLQLLVGPMTRHPGWLARATLTAGMVYEAAEHALDMDISRGLVFGGIPEPTEGQPFSPLPVVPPFLQMVGALAQAGVEGSLEPLQKSLPLTFPGGVGLARGIGYAPLGGGQKTAGKIVGRRYADYENALPDGRIPVYNANGSLIGYFSKTQLLGLGLGWGSLAAEREVQLTKYLISQRDVLRDYKRRYLTAITQGDYQEAMSIQDEFRRRFPGMTIPVEPSDVRAIHLREDVSRMERLLETMPADQRPMYKAVMATALGSQADALLGLQPGALSQPTINLRDPYRRRPIADKRRAFNRGLHGLKARDRFGLRGQDRIGRDPSNPFRYFENQASAPRYWQN